MDLVSLIVILVVVGVALWLINTYVPMQAGVKRLLNIAVVVLVALWLVSVFLGGTEVGNVRVGG